jgi:putative heme iron utilization protein
MDIDVHNKLIVEYKIKIHRTPEYKFFINGMEILDTSGILYFDLNSEITLIASETSGKGAIEIMLLHINGNEILKKYMHKCNPPTHWIENQPQWEFTIPSSFYAWYQDITGNGEIF